MAALAQADQTQRAAPPTSEADAKAMIEADWRRRARALALLETDALRDPRSFDHAALLFQHGTDPEDYVRARELALLACFHRATYGNMPMLAEDRFLLAIGQPQRFGTQFGPDGHPKHSVQTVGAFAVTDLFRLDVCVASLANAAQAPARTQQRLAQAMTVRDGKPHWLDRRSVPVQRELARLEAGTATPEATVQALLVLYQGDRLQDPSEYRRAAGLLGQCDGSRDAQLLANEWAAFAIMRGDSEAWNLFATTWDAFLATLGQPPHYRSSRRLIPALARLLSHPESHGKTHRAHQ